MLCVLILVMSDFISGLGDGFIQGFKETNQKW